MDSGTDRRKRRAAATVGWDTAYEYSNSPLRNTMLLTEAQYAALLKRGNVREIVGTTGRPTAPCPSATTRKGSQAPLVTKRQHRGRSAQGVALVLEWMARLTTIPPLRAVCLACHTEAQHVCTAWGWRCVECGTERLKEELCQRLPLNAEYSQRSSYAKTSH